MRNVIILGSGRSGTSMVAGTLAKSGYYMGDNFPPPREANPKGFFEDREVNEINELILAPLLPTRRSLFGRQFFLHRPVMWQRWLAELPLVCPMESPPEIKERIQKLTQNTPFCFKDPRFSYTLPVWRPYLSNTVFLCVFRDPDSTARSIQKECENSPLLNGEQQKISMSRARALNIWRLMYSHILRHHRHQGQWLFLHFNQVLIDEGLHRMADATGASVDRDFPDPKLRRIYSEGNCPEEAKNIYRDLCKEAEYKPSLE